MSPARTETIPSGFFAPQPAAKSIFPDGLKTGGQHQPVYELIQPFDKFPTVISGPTVWKKEDFISNPEKWTHPFTQEEITEISDAADKFMAAGLPLTGISKVMAESLHPSHVASLHHLN